MFFMNLYYKNANIIFFIDMANAVMHGQRINFLFSSFLWPQKNEGKITCYSCFLRVINLRNLRTFANPKKHTI